MTNECSVLMLVFRSGLILEGIPPIFHEIHIQNTTLVNYCRTRVLQTENTYGCLNLTTTGPKNLK